jgi:hypothetical protein
LASNVRAWLAAPVDRCLLLLAEFGDGKTFFGYQLGLELAREFRADPPRGWIPLRIALRTLRQHTRPGELLATRLAELGSNLAEWKELTERYRTLVILDGFDEMSARLDPETLTANVEALAACVDHFPNSKVIVSSRTHFFEHVKDYERFLDRVGRPRVLRIAPISLDVRLAHLRAFARRTGTEAKLEQIIEMYDPIGLAAKPLFLQMIKATLPDLPPDRFDELILYQRYVRKSLKWKVEDLRHEQSSVIDEELLANLHLILEDLALRLHTSPTDYVSLRELAVGRSDNLAEMLWRMSDAPPPDTERSDKDARARVGVRSLLKPVRGLAPDIWPVDFFHRSMREYFIARAIVRAIAHDRGRAENLLSHVPLQPEIVHFAVLLMRDPESVTARSTPAMFVDQLDSLARSATRAAFTGRNLGGNALTLLYALNGKLPHDNWSDLALDFAYLAGANLDGMSFRGSSMQSANLDNTSLAGTDFRDADLTGVQLEETAAVLAVALDEDSNAIFAGYSDNTVRRWTIGAGRRTTSTIVTKLNFRPDTIDLSPYKDLIVAGTGKSTEPRVVVLSATGTDDAWGTVSSFAARPDIRFVRVRQGQVIAHRIQQDAAAGPANLHLYAPKDRTVRTLLPHTLSGQLRCVLDEWTTIVREAPSRLLLTVEARDGLSATDRPKPVEQRFAVPEPVCLDARRLSGQEALLLLGHANGEISLSKITVDGSAPSLARLWQRQAHAGSVTAVRISGRFVLSGGMDRTLNLFPLRDGWAVDEPIRLHRTLHCAGLRIEGVRGKREQKLLRTLLQSGQAHDDDLRLDGMASRGTQRQRVAGAHGRRRSRRRRR